MDVNIRRTLSVVVLTSAGRQPRQGLDLLEADVSQASRLEPDTGIVRRSVGILDDVEFAPGWDDLNQPGGRVGPLEDAQPLAGVEGIDQRRAAGRAIMIASGVERATQPAVDESGSIQLRCRIDIRVRSIGRLGWPGGLARIVACHAARPPSGENR